MRIPVNQHMSAMCMEVEDKIIIVIKDRIIRDIKNVFELDEDY